MNDYSLIHAYVDDQLSTEERARVEKWIKEDPKAQSELDSIEAVKFTVSRQCEAVSCSETWSKCQGRLNELSRKSSVESFVGRWAWGLCSIFIVAIMSAAFMNRMNGPQIRSTDLMSPSLAPLAAPQSHSATEQKRWLRGLSIPLEPEVVKVDGAFEGRMNGQRVVRLDIRDNEGPLQLFVASCREFTDSEAQSTYGFIRVGEGYGLTWSQAGMSYLLVGPRSPQGLQTIADGIRQQ